MTTSELIQVLLTGALVLVTAIYAWLTLGISKATRKQAEASVKMAREMREQRYDAARPLIDIQREATGERRVREVFLAQSGDISEGLSCTLKNMGVGPAIDVYSFLQPPDSEPIRLRLGTLAVGEGTIGGWYLSLKHGSETAVVAYYRDVFGRAFESKRTVQIDRENHDFVLGTLATCIIEENKAHD